MMGKKAELILDRVMSQIILNNNKTGNFHKHQHFRKKDVTIKRFPNSIQDAHTITLYSSLHDCGRGGIGRWMDDGEVLYGGGS
jgi:hypothetical protein